MRVAVPRRRGPAGLRDLFRFCRNCGLYILRSGLSACARHGWYHYPRRALRASETPDGRLQKRLGLLYECFNENNPYDSEQIKADFEELYRQMNGMPLREMDRIVYPVCKLCRDHERAGVVEGIKIGVRLLQELG